MRLSKTHKYAIQWLVSQGKETNEIVNELKLPAANVQNFIEKNSIAQQKSTLKTKSGPIKSKDLMIRHTSSKNTNNVAIMTKEASEVGDEFKKNSVQSEPRHLQNIHKIS